MRGEYRDLITAAQTELELPPRARRIHCLGFLGGGLLGTTSACAENTGLGYTRHHSEWNYLRVRGEYKGHRIKPFTGEELPPRARRIPG